MKRWNYEYSVYLAYPMKRWNYEYNVYLAWSNEILKL